MKKGQHRGMVSGLGVLHDWLNSNRSPQAKPAVRHHCAIYPARHHAGDGE